jgi:hypothetical protein
MHFKKGPSGDPEGKPKELWEIRLEARKLSKIALEALATVCREGKSEAARVAAANAILDRGFGKSNQYVTSKPIETVHQISGARLVQLAMGLGEAPTEAELRAIEAANHRSDDSANLQ